MVRPGLASSRGAGRRSPGGGRRAGQTRAFEGYRGARRDGRPPGRLAGGGGCRPVGEGRRAGGQDRRHPRPLRPRHVRGHQRHPLRGAGPRDQRGDVDQPGATGEDGGAADRRAGAVDQPLLVRHGPGPRGPFHRQPERQAGGDRPGKPRPLLRPRHRLAPTPRTGRDPARGGDEAARPARRFPRVHHRRRGAGLAALRSVLEEGAGSERHGVPASPGQRARHRRRQADRGRGLAGQRHRQSARDHHRPVAPDLPGDLRPVPRPARPTGAATSAPTSTAPTTAASPTPAPAPRPIRC